MDKPIKLPGYKRVVTAVIMLLLTFVCFAKGGYLLALYLLIFIYLGTKELVTIARAKGLNPPFYYIYAIELGLVLLASFKLYKYLMPALVLGVIGAFFVILFRGSRATINDISISILCIFYAGLFPTYIMLLRDLDGKAHLPNGFEFPIGIGLIVLMLFVVAACDIGAYFVGKNIGKKPLFKEISPKKTLEGSVGGTICGIFFAVLTGYLIGLNLWISALAGLIISIVGQFGDLCESMFKRDAGVKDSGNLLPGHGGVLDRVDSYIFNGAVSYYFFKYFVIDNSLLSSIISFCS